MRVLGDLNLVKSFDKVPATIWLKIGIVSVLELSSLGKWSPHFLQLFTHPFIHNLPNHSAPTRIKNLNKHLVLSRFI
jgi:hypothetical protein